MKRWFALAALNGAIAVAAGAFAAHGLKTHLTPDMLTIFDTSARYHLIHAMALALTALAADRYSPRLAQLAALLFAAGIILFCGSLYALALTGLRTLGLITPLGGMAFIAGWLALAASSLMQED